MKLTTYRAVPTFRDLGTLDGRAIPVYQPIAFSLGTRKYGILLPRQIRGGFGLRPVVFPCD